MLTKDIILIFTSLISVSVSFAAFIFSRKATFKSSRVEASNRLRDAHEKTRAGRAIMDDIFSEWIKTQGIQLAAKSMRDPGNGEQKSHFIDFYNNHYHAQNNDTKERKMRNEIHSYLHELDALWRSHVKGELTTAEIMNWFSSAINMDGNLIMIYLEAHWKEHDQLKKELKDRFWNYVPTFVEEAKKWRDQYLQN